MHAPVPQVRFPHAALPSAQVCVQAPSAQIMAPHALSPVHVRVQLPAPHDSEPHTALPPPPLQVCVQLPLVHVTLAHAFAPVHVTSQFLVMHDTPRHAFALAHRTLHDAALPQSSDPHAPGVGHVMSQFQPAGHVIEPLPVPVIVHVVVAMSQLLQIAGHTNASGGAASIGSVPMMQ